ncbi:MAG: hypothetical protein WB444_07540 [Gallionella sp.]
MRQPAVNVRNLVGQARHIIYHCVMGRSVKMWQVVARSPVNGDAERPDAGACRLEQRTPRVFDAAVQYVGLILERWFFFAQPNHPQNLSYQTV